MRLLDVVVGTAAVASGPEKARRQHCKYQLGTVTLTEHRSKCGIWRHDQICT